MIGLYSFYESCHQHFAGDDDSVLLTGLKAILVSAIFIPVTILMIRLDKQSDSTLYAY